MRAHTRVCRRSPTCSSSSSESQRHCLPRVSSQPCYRPRLKCLCAAQLDSTPLLTALHDRGKSLQASFHVPGHKRGSQASESAKHIIGDAAFRHDFTELPGLDYLASPNGVIQQAQNFAATAFGADQTWFLVNGTSVGIHAAVMSTCGPGDCLVLARNCHQSAFAAAAFAGCDTWYVQPQCDTELGIAHGVYPQSLQQAIEAGTAAGKHVKAVLVVSPTYFGACSDISGLADVCHKSGIPLIVDEAHSSHFVFDHAFPQSGLSGGADCVVQSSHKTLSALTQAAMLHVTGARLDRGRISQALQLLQSSSPSYLLMASLDGARAHAQQQGIWEEPLRAGQLITNALQELPGLHILSSESVGTDAIAALDPLRITVGVGGLGLTGVQVSTALEEEYGVVAELATQQVVVFALGIGTTFEHAEMLITAFQRLCAQADQQNTQQSDAADVELHITSLQRGGVRKPVQPADEVNSLQRMSLREAFFAKTVRVSCSEAAGRVSAELLCPYPPGVPAAIPGELLQHATIQHLLEVLKTGGTVTGLTDPTLATCLVIAK